MEITLQDASQPVLIVGVGASAGGLQAFKELLGAIPDHCPMTFLFVQHLDPKHESLLVELLAPYTTMRVRDADHGAVLEPNSVYIIRPDTALAVKHGRIELSQPTIHRGIRLPVDHLLSSLAQEYGQRAAGIILSGAGSDGSVGIRDIKTQGGLCIAQDPETCGHTGMPQSAIDTGLIDLVLSIDKMPETLLRFSRMREKVGLEVQDREISEPVDESELIGNELLERLGELLKTRLDFDLGVYRSSTVMRRLLRRMTLSGFDKVEDYFAQLTIDQGEQQQLVRDLLISVTEFFRDPKSFKALHEIVVDPLVASSAPGETLRAWVPGCATGEEAYSIAMEFLDAIECRGKRLNLQLFATDIDHDALAFARLATYPPSIAERIPDSRLARYFTSLGDSGFRAKNLLRDSVSFSTHDLTKDPPFSHMDLVSCRNVLIYLTTEAQIQVLKTLHFALDSAGHLMLSNSESTGSLSELFATVSKPYRIYKKVGASRAISISRTRRHQQAAGPPADETRIKQGANIKELARNSVLDACVPPTVVVARDGSVIYMHGRLERYLHFPRDSGPDFDLISLIPDELETRTRGALYKCRRDEETVVAHSTLSKTRTQVRISAHFAPKLGDGTVILTFEDEQVPPTEQEQGETDARTDQASIVEHLEKELEATREDLKNTVEELESTNEALRSTNEESMSMNEELRSANEELEATTEELRSLNEELTTVNWQLREKVEQVERAHDDLQNFFASANVATIFLDDQLCINRFTPAARDLLHVSQADIGRHISHVARELIQHELEHEAQMVLRHLSERSQEIRTREGHWFARRVLPYRTENQRIAGVVVTFVDISVLKNTTESLQVREQQNATISRLGLLALSDIGLHEFMTHIVREVRSSLNADYCKLLESQPGGDVLLLRAGSGWRPGYVGEITESSNSSSPAGYALRTGEPAVIEDLSSDPRFSIPPLLTDHAVTSGATCMVGDGGYRYGAIGFFTRSHRKFSSTDIHFIQAVANILSSAINRHQGRMRLGLELAVAKVLSEAIDLEESLGVLLERMSSEIGSSVVAELWWPAAHCNRKLYRRAFHVAPASQRQRVQSHMHVDKLDVGVGLAGHVYETAKAAWYTDLGVPKLSDAVQGTAELNLISAVAFPLLANETIGVITLLSSERLFADESYLRSLESIGRAIGSFISRWEVDLQSRELASMTESSHDAIYSYGVDGTVTRWLHGAQDLFGFAENEMVGQSIFKLVPPDRLSEFREVQARVLSGERVEPIETDRLHKHGDKVPVSERSSAIVGRNGQTIGVTSTARDISKQKETEDKLRQADYQKDEFLAMLGHELRNPVAAIRSAIDILALTSTNDPEASRAREILDRQARQVAGLLDGLLDVSRIIRGQIRLAPIRMDLAECCREVVQELIDRTGADTRTFKIQIPKVPLWLHADPIRIVQIVDNLLSNAIRYTGHGDEIQFSLAVKSGKAELKIRDSGVGIRADLLQGLFDVFCQAEQELYRPGGGLGIGLALVKSLTELHGGSVTATSEGVGKGAQFTVTLPLGRAPRRREDLDALAHTGDGVRILIIEDNDDAAAALAKVLELSGHTVFVAHDGSHGLELAQAKSPDVILCDIGLPGEINGYDFASLLRQHEATAYTPLVAVSGYGRPEDKAKARDSGFDLHITKPIDLPTLERIVSELA